MNPFSRKASQEPSLNGTDPAKMVWGNWADSTTSPLPTSNDSQPGQNAAHVEALLRRIAINQLTTLRWSLSADLDEYRRHGVNGIGLHWRKLQEFGVRRSIRSVQRSQMAVSSLGWIGGFTGEHGHSLFEAMREARRIIRVAGQLGARTVTVVTGPQAGHIRSHAFRIIVEALQELSQLAATYQIQLALQPMHTLFSKNWSFLHSLDDALTILDRAGDSRLKLAFGTYHLWEEPDLLERAAEVASRIGLVTLADWGGTPRNENDRLLPGEGCLPLQDVVQTLETHGFSGWYELEVWSRDLWKLESRDLMRRCVAARAHLTAQPATC